MSRKPNGYWNVWTNFENELKKVIAQVGYFPNYKDLAVIKRDDISNAANRHYNSLNSVREKMGYKLEKRSRGYWENWNNFEKEIRLVIQEIGHFPTKSEAIEKGLSGVYHAFKSYGGARKVKIKLGLESKKRNQGHWKSISNVKAELEKIMQEHKLERLPTGKELSDWGYSGLNTAIGDYHGGIVKMRQIFNQNLMRVENGLWKDEKYALGVAREVMKKLKITTLPSFNQLSKAGYSSLAFAITKHHGGAIEFRKKLGEKKIRAKMGAWKDLDYAIEQARLAMNKEGWDRLPSQSDMVTKGYSSLTVAIVKYHEGYPIFRSKLESKFPQFSDKERLSNLLEDYVNSSEVNAA